MITKSKSLFKLSIPTPFPVGPINVYLLKGDYLVLIDTGPNTEEALTSLKLGLKELGYDLQDIEKVVLTHHHSDHAGLVDQFEHAEIYGHWRNEPWITFDESFYSTQRKFVHQFFQREGVEKDILKNVIQDTRPDRYLCKSRLDKLLKEGDVIPGSPEWKVIETPGHAQSHLSFYNEQDGALIAGDNVIEHLYPTPLIEHPYNEEEERPKTLLQLRNTLTKHLDYDLDIAYSGHGEDVYDIKANVEKLLSKHEERASKVRQFLKEGNLTGFEISKRLFPNAYDRATYLTMSETVGILDLMISRYEISTVSRNENQIEYSLT